MYCKKSVLRNFAKFTIKNRCQSLSFYKVVGLRPTTLLKIGSGTSVSCEFCEISKNKFFHRSPLVAASENIAPNFHVRKLIRVLCRKILPVRHFPNVDVLHLDLIPAYRTTSSSSCIIRRSGAPSKLLLSYTVLDSQAFVPFIFFITKFPPD